MRGKIGIGTVQFGLKYGISNEEGKTPLADIEEILTRAAAEGIRYVDSAFAYGDAEENLGNFDLTSFRIVSKYIDSAKLDLKEQFDTSLKRLKVDQLYGYLAHRPLDLIENNNASWRVLQTLKSQGKVQKIGASFNSLEELKALRTQGLELDIIQVPYNILDRRFESAMQELKSKGCEIHTRSAFLQGLFFCNPKELSTFFDEVKPFIELLSKQSFLAQRLLKFVLQKDFIDVVNIGLNNASQLEKNINNLDNIELDFPPIPKLVNTKILIPSEWPKQK